MQSSDKRNHVSKIQCCFGGYSFWGHVAPDVCLGFIVPMLWYIPCHWFVPFISRELTHAKRLVRRQQFNCSSLWYDPAGIWTRTTVLPIMQDAIPSFNWLKHICNKIVQTSHRKTRVHILWINTHFAWFLGNIEIWNCFEYFRFLCYTKTRQRED